MIKMKNELKTRCEFALMGIAQPIKETEVKDVISYIASAINDGVDVEEVFNTMFKYCSEGYEVKHFTTNTIEDMFCLTVTLSYPDEIYDIEDGRVLCSVYNFTAPYCSELGYCYFKRTPQGIKRIG